MKGRAAEVRALRGDIRGEQVAIRVVLNQGAIGRVPVIEELATQQVPPHAPGVAVSTVSEPRRALPELIEMIDLEREVAEPAARG